MKQASDLRPVDFAAHPVWEFAPEEIGIDECSMIPVLDLPVENLDQRCLGTEVILADGTKVWAILYELWPQMTVEQLISSQKFRFFRGDSACDWPAEDFQPGTVDADGLADFLDRGVEAVFPFTYDVSKLVVGEQAVTRRSVAREEEDSKFWRVPLDPALVAALEKAMNQ